MEVFTYIGYTVGVIGAALTLASKTKTDNLTDLKQRVEILEKEREYAKQQHLDNQKAIAHLEGQLTTYKDIPLQQIATSLGSLAQYQEKVLMRLDENAQIAKKAAESGGMLVKNVESNPLAVKDVTK